MPRQPSETYTEFLGKADSTVIDPTNMPDSVSPDAANLRPRHGELVGRGGHHKSNTDCYFAAIRDVKTVVLNEEQFVFIITDEGDIYEAPVGVTLWAKVPVDEDLDTLQPHFQLDDTSDCSSPVVDIESKNDANFWEYRCLDWTGISPAGAAYMYRITWRPLPSTGISIPAMGDVRNGFTVRVRYTIPSGTSGLTRGKYYMRVRWYQPRYAEYSAWTSIKTVYI